MKVNRKEGKKEAKKKGEKKIYFPPICRVPYLGGKILFSKGGGGRI